MKVLRLIVFAPAAVIAFTTPVSADTFNEDFDDNSYDLSVQLGANARWCSEYSDQYGTSGPSLCLFNTANPTVFTFPDDVQVQGFEFMAGAKNGTVDLTVTYDDETTDQFPIDGSCCETTVQVVGTEGKHIVSFSIPADWDLWLFDSLVWFGVQAQTPTTTTESPTTLPEPSTTLETTTTSTTTTSTTVAAVIPPPPPVEETTVPSTFPATSVAPSTTETPTTTLPPATSTIPSPTTLPATTVPAATIPPDTSGSAESDANPDPVPDTGLVEQPPSDASFEEKLEFESKVDVFSGEYDDYVPAGSTISVAQRRTVVAVTAVLIMFAPPPTRMRRT